MKHTVDFDEYMNMLLQKPTKVKAYAQAIFEEYERDGNIEAFLIGLFRLAKAQGGVTELAEKTSLNRQNLYKLFSGKSVPRIDTLALVLNGLGLRLSVESIRKR